MINDAQMVEAIINTLEYHTFQVSHRSILYSEYDKGGETYGTRVSYEVFGQRNSKYNVAIEIGGKVVHSDPKTVSLFVIIEESGNKVVHFTDMPHETFTKFEAIVRRLGKFATKRARCRFATLLSLVEGDKCGDAFIESFSEEETES